MRKIKEDNQIYIYEGVKKFADEHISKTHTPQRSLFFLGVLMGYINVIDKARADRERYPLNVFALHGKDILSIYLQTVELSQRLKISDYVLKMCLAEMLEITHLANNNPYTLAELQFRIMAGYAAFFKVPKISQKN